jgi:hypothetical protein
VDVFERHCSVGEGALAVLSQNILESDASLCIQEKNDINAKSRWFWLTQLKRRRQVNAKLVSAQGDSGHGSWLSAAMNKPMIFRQPGSRDPDALSGYKKETRARFTFFWSHDDILLARAYLYIQLIQGCGDAIVPHSPTPLW